MRTLLVLCMVSGLVLAAPIKQTREQVKAEVAGLWKTANDPKDVVAATRAFFALLDHPYTVEFLEQELVAVKCTKAEIEKWLEDLNTGDDGAQKKAIAKLNYFHPSLHLRPKEICESLTSEQGKKWVHEVLFARPFPKMDAYEGGIDSTRYDIINGKPGLFIRTLIKTEKGSMSIGTNQDIEPLIDLELKTWFPTMKGLLILSLQKSEKAKSTLKYVATGSDDAEPTRYSKQLLEPKRKELKATSDTWQTGWSSLIGYRKLPNGNHAANGPNGHGIPTTLLDLMNHPECIASFKAELKPIITYKDNALECLKNLSNMDAKIAKESYEYLAMFSPRLVLTDDEMMNANAGEAYASRLYGILSGGSTFQEYVMKGSSIAIHNDSIEYGYDSNIRMAKKSTSYPKISEMTTQRWTRQRLGIILLERLGTPEAKAILEDLAKGDKRILPTRDAVDALARWKGK